MKGKGREGIPKG